MFNRSRLFVCVCVCTHVLWRYSVPERGYLEKIENEDKVKKQKRKRRVEPACVFPLKIAKWNIKPHHSLLIVIRGPAACRLHMGSAKVREITYIHFYGRWADVSAHVSCVDAVVYMCEWILSIVLKNYNLCMAASVWETLYFRSGRKITFIAFENEIIA